MILALGFVPSGISCFVVGARGETLVEFDVRSVGVRGPFFRERKKVARFLGLGVKTKYRCGLLFDVNSFAF